MCNYCLFFLCCLAKLVVQVCVQSIEMVKAVLHITKANAELNTADVLLFEAFILFVFAYLKKIRP